MHHYITKYQDENGKLRIVSWLQINVKDLDIVKLFMLKSIIFLNLKISSI